MFALDFIKSDDTSNVVLRDAEAVDGEDAITRTTKGRLVPGGKYVNVPNFKGFTKVSSSKPSTHHSSRFLKGPSQSSATDPVDLSDDIEVSEDQGVEVEAKKDTELAVVIGKKGKSKGKKVVMSAARGSSERSGEVHWRVILKEIEGFAEKEKAWVMKVGELTSRHEVEINELKKRMEVGKLQLKANREALNVQKKAFSKEKEGLKASLAQATSDD
ncbi:hypothetical protein HanRHA438_Chr15g0711791 [Helianthus annuus]|nr:hypothetical protein HanLR1_Chr15g0580671 [Helianthus annuus]KAJ0652921.1 hypothetical protein HanOQP8_Chr15g0577701 [Helianthus annuus]KAJ0831791.1 hypothetical protein HanPSC8_Chr15g0671211 [Helianthus annuus]KAJ0845275.1 hypothetical protein HanRHA438_Chr15g0711791 [Helianthus annuus]